MAKKQARPDSEVNLVMNILPLFSGECAAVHCALVDAPISDGVKREKVYNADER